MQGLMCAWPASKRILMLAMHVHTHAGSHATDILEHLPRRHPLCQRLLLQQGQSVFSVGGRDNVRYQRHARWQLDTADEEGHL